MYLKQKNLESYRGRGIAVSLHDENLRRCDMCGPPVFCSIPFWIISALEDVAINMALYELFHSNNMPVYVRTKSTLDPWQFSLYSYNFIIQACLFQGLHSKNKSAYNNMSVSLLNTFIKYKHGK